MAKPTVRVCEGILEGELVNNSLGGQYYSFKGIPFAEPPVGDLRFKAPRPPKPWNGIRKATEFGSICFQFDMMRNCIPQNASEDCLYLNVYSPELTPAEPLAVMVWIHGSGFKVGSGNDDTFGPSFLVKQNVILVTCNYRLEVLGFLSLETDDIPGNAGMKDQVEALRWVQRNIKSFGGDPNNVTVFGESAGGASVCFHLISEMSKGLFTRAIVQSGSFLAYWAIQSHPRERALVLAKKLGCDSEDDNELYQFFRDQPLENLVNVEMPLTYAEAVTDRMNVFFSIVDEKHNEKGEKFFHGDIRDILRQKGIHDDVAVLTGYTEDEGVVAAFITSKVKTMLDEGNKFFEFFTPGHMRFSASAEEQMQCSKLVKKRYFGEKRVCVETIVDYFNSHAAESFIVPTIQLARLVAPKNKIYLYKFTCKTERNITGYIIHAHEFCKDRVFVGHGEDLMYLFDVPFLDLKDLKPETSKLIETVTKLWTNFAKFGELTPDDSLGVRCSPYTLTEQEYLDIGNQLVVGRKPDDEEFQFWEALYKQYCAKFTTV